MLSKSYYSITKKAEAVRNLEVNQCLGTWYEITRLDFRFKKN